MIAIFKNLADQAKPSVEGFEKDFEALRNHYGFNGDHFASSMLYDKLDKEIKALMQTVEKKDGIKRKTLTDLMGALVYESVLDEIDNSYYLTLLKIISSKEPLYRPFSDEDHWIKAIGHAKDYNLIYPDTHSIRPNNVRQNFAKDFDIAAAASCLRDLNCTVTIKETELEFDGLEAVAQSIEELIIEFGPVAFINAAIQHMVAHHIYVPEYRRYIIRNEISFLSSDATPMLPFGFLLNLAVKHVGKPDHLHNAPKTKALLDEISLKAKLLATIADARHYGIWEVHFINEDNLLDAIRSFGLFDAIFAFPTADLNDIIEYMQHLFVWQDDELFFTHFGFRKQDVIDVTKIVNQYVPDNGSKVIYASAIHKRLKHFSKEKVIAILTQLSHESGSINKHFTLTEHYNFIDFGFKPLIRLSPTMFLLCDKSWCATAFYEGLAAMVRELDSKDNQSNHNIGYALEDFVRFKFREKSISFHKGDYAGAVKGEADGVVETEKSIILMEVKKKVLTRRSKTGSTISLIIDLAGSLLEAQVQAGRTELLLREQGYVELDTEVGTTRIEFNNREIERLALTQWDFGSFQDRGIINTILTMMVNTEFTLINQEQSSDVVAFKKMQKLRKEHETQAAKLIELDSRFDHSPFYSCWFLSVPQLLVLLKYSCNAEEFYEAIRATKSVTMSSMNFYFEFLISFIRQSKRNPA